MRITLSISANQGLMSELETSKTIEQGAITIGRGVDNDWVLPDPERIVSNRHCTIQYRDGEYFITDTSTNGVFVNHSEDRIERGESLKLHDHDHLSLGSYEFLVRIEPAAGFDDIGGVTAAGLVTDIIFTPELDGDQPAAVAASVPHLGESGAMGEDALQGSEYGDDLEEELNTEKPKSESSKEDEYLGVTEFDWPADKNGANSTAASELDISDPAASETAEEDVLKVDDIPQGVAHQDIAETDESTDLDDSQAHGAMTSELEELFGVDEDRPAAALRENVLERETPGDITPFSEELEISEKAQTAQGDAQQEKAAEVKDLSEYKSMDSEPQVVLERNPSPEKDVDLRKSFEAPNQSDEIIPEDWWRDESSQIHELPVSAIDLPIQQTNFLLETRLAEHFREQQKHVSFLINGFYRYLQPYCWGIETLQLDEDALARGEIAIALARGLMSDGAFFDVPTADEAPEPLPIGREIREAHVVLSPSGDYEAAREQQQNNSQFPRSAPVDINGDVSFQTQRLPLRLQLDSKISSQQPGIAIARIREVRPDQQVILDETYVPPALDCHQMPILNDHINEIRDLLQHCGNTLAVELDAKSDDNAAVVPLLLLQVINRYDVGFAHLANTALVHPVDLYQQLIQLVAEMATFVKNQRRPSNITSYDHRNLGPTFAPLLTELRQLLRVHRQQARQIPLQERGYGVSVAFLGDRERRLLESADLILEIGAAGKTLTGLLSNQMTIGPVEKIAQLVNQKQPGIGLNPLPTAPRGVTPKNNTGYFRLDKQSPAWQQLSTSKGLAFHVMEELAELEMRLWVITA
jgi:type VI secretion system protein ImpJ